MNAAVKFDPNKVVVLPNRVRVANCTPHEIVFLTSNGEEILVESCGPSLKAKPVEEEVQTGLPVKLVKTVFEQSEEGLAEISQIKAYGQDILLVGSLVSAQAYKGLVVGMTPAPGYERVPVAEKRMSPDKFTVF